MNELLPTLIQAGSILAAGGGCAGVFYRWTYRTDMRMAMLELSMQQHSDAATETGKITRRNSNDLAEIKGALKARGLMNGSPK